MAVLVGCPQKEAPPPSEKTQGPVVEPNDPAVVDIPFDKAAPDDPARLPKPPQQRPLEVAVRYILVSHVGVKNGVNEREKSAAEKRAWRLAQAARKQGADFGALARRFSDAPAASRGALEVFREGDADPAFLDAAMGIGVGQVADPVHTEFGYYVILREELEEYSTAHILVIYKGAKLAPPAMKRTKEEAHKRALMLLAKARKKGANFALLAGRYSDSPSKVRGGVIAPIRPGKLIEGFEPYLDAVRQLKVGQISDVVETPYGFHIIRRLPLKKVQVRHILIAYDGAETKPRKSRRKSDALTLATTVRDEARQPGANFAELAKKYSDGPSAERGGLLQPFARGEMAPRFEQFAFALAVGQISDVVETRFGYHIIKRER